MSTTITCADCGSTQTIPPLPPRGTAECTRCDRELAHRAKSGFTVPLVCSICMLALLPAATFLPLMDSTFRRLLYQQSRLVTSIPVIYGQVWFPFAFGFLFFALLFPAIRAALLIIVLAGRVPQRGRLFRYAEELKAWSMTDVVVIAGAIAYFRASIPAQVVVRVGAWSYVAVAALSFIINRTVDRRAVWNAIMPDVHDTVLGDYESCSVCEMVVRGAHAGDFCPRCGGTLGRDLVKRFTPALAAIAAAIPLCLPAFSFAIIVNDQLAAVLENTVLGTVQMLADYGYWQYGVVVLVAGVVIPILELLGMVWLLARVRFPSSRGLVTRTRVYRILHRLVRWPMIIPFVAAIAAPIVNYRGIDEIVTGPGATPLFAVVALTMLAVRLFEPRLMWQAAGEVTA